MFVLIFPDVLQCIGYTSSVAGYHQTLYTNQTTPTFICIVSAF